MKNGDKVIVSATVEQIRFFKDQWGIIICSIDTCKQGNLKKGEEYVFKGEMPQPKIGEKYKIIATFVNDPKWGDQFDIVNILLAVSFDTTNEAGKKKFLSALFIESKINALYETLEDPYATLAKHDVLSLTKVKGIQIKTATSMIAKFEANLNKARIFTELEDYSLTDKMITKLLDRYDSPDIVIEKVKNNPYILCTEVKGIGWKKADQIALSGDISEDDPRRIQAYILYYLAMVGEDGYSWITPDHLLGAIIEGLGEEISDTNITKAIHGLEDALWWNEDKSKIGLKKYYNYEYRVAEELIRLRNAESDFIVKDWKKEIHELELKQGWEFTDEQIDGIKLGFENNVLLIHGLAGSGKSSLVKAILQVYKDYPFVQTSLSGRAASRMSEITGREGYTIHRLLGYPKGDAKFQKFEFNQENQLYYEIYIIDEISMVDVKLLYYLLRAIPDGSKVIFLGDHGQLESIGAGNVAHDIINSEEIASIELTQVHRQAAKSAIITDSIAIRKGNQIIEKDWVGEQVRGELKDLHLKCYSDASKTFYEIMNRFNLLFHEEDFNIMDVQVIVPIKNRGDANVYKLNNGIQEVYNPLNKQEARQVYTSNGLYEIREGDKVINRVNNYYTRPFIYNGNIGIVKKITYDYEEDCEVMVIHFYGIGDVIVPSKFWKGIELGYAITTHSFQGSQADTVIYGLDFSSFSLLTREQVYTAITRAKKMCYLIAQTGALRMAISKEGVSKKQTHLQQCLHDIAHPKLIF